MISKRIKQLRNKFNQFDIDGYIIPKNDEFFSEYSFPNRLKLISNFSGSAGLAIILKNKNLLFVDGRYTLQAHIECGSDFKIFEIPKIKPSDVIKKNGNKLKLGFDPKLFTEISLKMNFSENCNLVPINNNLIDQIYKLKKRDLEGIHGLDLDPDKMQIIGSTEGNILSAEKYLSIIDNIVSVSHIILSSQ